MKPDPLYQRIKERDVEKKKESKQFKVPPAKRYTSLDRMKFTIKTV